MLIIWTLSLLVLLHVEELKHHVFHEVVEELLVGRVATFRLGGAAFVVVVFGVESLREIVELANTGTTNPFDSLFFLLSDVLDLWVGNVLSSDH